ncbi:DUF4097 family beta strand repeat-containing protein [Acidobacteria bacterium AH-259-G07]|nr:DUF4097 family beta strand repeat-containing protein [Acidobacteria bacterium AH-259-G07]
MSDRRSILPLILGLLLMALGCLFLLGNLYSFRIQWFELLKFVIPGLLLWMGLAKLVRHFTWDEAQLLNRPKKAGLLGGIFWTSVGFLILFEITTDIDALGIFGHYWPLILILFGVGKIIDFYRLKGRLPFRPAEVVGIVFIMFLGFASGKAASVPLRLVDFDVPWVIGERKISLGEFTGKKYRWEIEERIPLNGAQLFEMTNLYGDIRVDTGSSDDVEVHLSKVIFHRSEDKARQIADEVILSSEIEGKTLRVRTNREELDRNYRFNTHFTVRIPENLQLRLHNGYGDIRVSRVKAPCDLENSHGEVEVEFIVGDVKITNKYRPVKAAHIEGNLSIENRRGRVQVEDVAGEVEVATDYDSISARRIEGNFSARNHFGRVRVEAVSGKATIEGSGSQVTISDIGKAVRIENSHKAVKVAEVSEEVELDTSYSRVDLSEIRGAVIVRAAHSEINGEGLYAGVSVQARASAIDLSDITGSLHLATSLRRLVVSDFRGDAEIQNEYGDIILSLEDPLVGPLSASNRNGEITLSIPSEASFKLSAQASGGKVVSDFKPPSASSEQDMEVLEFVAGRGQPEIRLQTTYSRIQIKKRD